jgi:protoporphyrin/coproporphyrin ferrochelatase
LSVRHVVLLTYGEPADPGFFPQLKYSWRILLGLTRTVAPIPKAVVPVIAVSRARLRTATWKAEAYSSPLEAITVEQAGVLARLLAQREPGTQWRVHPAYEFRDPLLTGVIESLPADEPVDVVPMYVADSAFTHGISRGTLAAWERRRFPDGRPARVRVMPALDEAAFADISARHVLDELARLGVTPGADWALMLAAHGTLLEPPRPYETGRGATECVCTGIAQHLAGHFGKVQNGWLNHVYGGKWTQPPADEALKAIAGAGFRKVVYYPYGFFADNAETQLEGRVALRGQPGLHAVHLPCLNAAPSLMAMLADQLVGERIPETIGAVR